MATAFLLCGLATAGKTTFARRLAREKEAVRFTLDERMLAKHDLTIFDEAYGPLSRQEKHRIWEEAKWLLDEGRDVILDWSLWNREARREWAQRVTDAGHSAP